ncbi:MAG TPA: hypothetical protein PLE74_09600 [Candidatus Cloacimonadota bacterium]|nr:hypothetical protein [Candidatus Cloacimonadota bacterium]HPT72519.1 hypothetical protein [Candidatus Cloacimonadota bacterium]
MNWQEILNSLNSNVLWHYGKYPFLALGAILLFFFSVYLLRNIIWQLRYPFLLLNWVQWVSYNPIRDQWRDPHNFRSHMGFNLLLLSGIALVWWCIMHIALTPIRLMNAIYFNIILYWTVNLCDSLDELFHPRKGEYRHAKWKHYWKLWFSGFPRRFMHVFSRNGSALLEGLLMVGVDTVFPTYTMYHGTSFKGVATNIAQKGRWLVGGGDYAGSGIYFGFYKKTAEHYAQDEDHAIIVARVTLFPCRNSATFPGRLRKKIGSDGIGITEGLGFPWKSIEHWRDHSYAQWFEYCLIQPDMAGKYVRTWRARPIAILKNNMPSRIWGGISLWTSGAGGVGAIIFSWFVLIVIATYLYSYIH